MRLFFGALLSGALICLCFPKWNLGFLAWVSLVPLTCAALALDSKKSFFLGWLGGTAGFCGILYWIIPTFHAAQVSTAIGVVSLIILSSYIGLYYGIFFSLLSAAARKYGPVFWVPFGAALWIALEWIRGTFLSGFPWGGLGYTQWEFIPAIQIGEWTGVYGVSAQIVLVNLIAASLWISKKFKFSNWLILSIFIGANGFLYYKESARPSTPELGLNVSILQGNIDQYQKWDKQYVRDILSAYEGLALASTQGGMNPDLVVWPETALPGWIPREERLFQWMQNLAEKTRAHHLVGAVTQDGGKSYNSGFLFAADGNLIGRYDKIRLVPFGEFVPFQPLLGRWIGVLNDLGGFDGGEPAKILEFPSAKLGVNICYEAIFPELPRRQVKNGAQAIVNITNDGWYLNTAAPEQHFAMNVLRAVENRKTVVRAANTGISGVIAPVGKIQARTRLMERTFLNTRVPLRNDVTFYARYGNWFVWLCAALTALGTARIFFKENKIENAQ